MIQVITIVISKEDIETKINIDARVYDLYFRYNTGFYEANSLWSNAVLGELRTAVTLAALFR
jgi:hypothetical protein